MLVHMMRVFFTGAFRKPRELNWLFGSAVAVLGMLDGFFGYSLPDDLLSGTGIRFLEGVILSVPIVGTYLSMFLFGGEFPGDDIIPRFYTVHVLLIPGIMLGLFATHLILVFYHKHTQFPGPGPHREKRGRHAALPVYVAKAGGFFFLVFGVISVLAALATINPIWVFGPYRPGPGHHRRPARLVHGLLEGLIRMMPGWEINGVGPHPRAGRVHPAAGLPAVPRPDRVLPLPGILDHR